MTDFRHGRLAELYLDGADVSAYFNDLGLSVDVESGDTTTFKAAWKTALPGQASAKVDTKGLYDPAFDDLPAILQSAGNVLTVAPAGMATIGDRCRLLKVLATVYAESSPVGGIVGFSWAALADGQVGMGQIVHPLATEDEDGDGGTTDYVDLGTAAAGAVAHLHVTAVSAGESIVVKLQDAATPTGGGADWADVTGGAFASKSAAGAERLAIAGTVRRYVRAAWDITDNGGTVAVTFAVAVARLP